MDRLVKQFAIMVIIVTEFVGADITDVRIGGEYDTNHNNTRVVYMKEDGLWKPVCQDEWGQSEALVACRQLEHDGGWPIKGVFPDANNASATQYLTDFECEFASGSSLGECTYDLSDTCTDSRLIRVHCYDNFTVNLVNVRNASNMGRVEVQYDDVWYDVCYDRSSSIKWSFLNAQVVCKERGFPGTMMHRRGAQGESPRPTVVNSYKCKHDSLESKDASEPSLKDCLRDPPINRSTSCGANNAAIAVCTVPGYVGCFQSNVTNVTFDPLTLINMNINTCRRHCRQNGYTYAYLQTGNTCFCSNVTSRDSGDDKECTVECSGNSYQICGGNTTVSVYEVNRGSCSNPLNTTDVYYYGDFLNCGDGMKLVGDTPLQCIMGYSSHNVIWSHKFTRCEVIEVIANPKDKTKIFPQLGGSMNMKILIAMSVGCTILLLLIVLLLFIMGKRKCNRNYNAVKTDNKPETASNDDNNHDNACSINGTRDEEPRYQQIEEIANEQNDETNTSEKCEVPAYEEITSQVPTNDKSEITKDSKPWYHVLTDPLRDFVGEGEAMVTFETPTPIKGSLHYDSVAVSVAGSAESGEVKETKGSGHYDSVAVGVAGSADSSEVKEVETHPVVHNVFPEEPKKGWVENTIYDSAGRDRGDNEWCNIDLNTYNV